MTLGTCKLCDESRELRLSHALPASAFNYIFRRESAHGKAVAIVRDKTTPIGYSSDSWDVQLLCGECERYLNEEYDSYGISTLKGEHCKVRRHDAGVTFTGINRQRLRMFVLSLLWRVSVSHHPNYSNIDLRDEWEEELHKPLKSRTKVRTSLFTVRVRRLRDSTGIKALSMESLRGFVLAPFPRNHGGYISVCFLLFGFLIEVFVPNLPDRDNGIEGVVSGKSPVFLAPYLEVAEFPELLSLLVAGLDKHESGFSRVS